MIVQAIPGSGKTFLKRANPDKFVDADDYFVVLGFPKASKSAFDTVLNDPKKSFHLASLISANDARGKVVLCNFDPKIFGLYVDRRFSYKEEDYIAHLDEANRHDLLTKFRDTELIRWADSYVDKDHVVWLKPNEFLSQQEFFVLPHAGQFDHLKGRS